MSHRASEWAFRLEIPPTERFVAVALGDRADTEGICWPSHRDMSERTGFSLATIKRAIRQLSDWGLIEVERRYTITGKSTSHLYRLRLDRKAPVEVAEQVEDKRGVNVTPSSLEGGKSEAKTAASAKPRGAGAHGEPPPAGADGAHGDTAKGLTVNPSYMNRQSEPISPTPNSNVGLPGRPPSAQPPVPTPSASSERASGPADQTTTAGASGTAAGSARKGTTPILRDDEEIARMRDGFRRLVDNWQQTNWTAFIGDEKQAWKTWRRMDDLRREKALASWPLCRNAWKAQYARWSNAPKTDRGRRPKVPSVAEYLRLEIWESVGLPVERKPEAEADTRSIELCRAIMTSAAGAAHWVSEGSPEWEAWAEFFRSHGFRALPVRASIFADQYDFGAAKGERGWRFPSPWPPASEAAGQREEQAAQ